MSSAADTDDVVEVSDEGVRVRKSFTVDEFPVPTIRFEIESSRSEPVTIRLTERIPESFPMDSVGFHPEYHSDQWVAYQDNRVEFTATVGPDETLVTVYGVRIDDEGEGSQFLTEPSIEIVRSSSDEPDEPADDGEQVEDTTIDDIIADDRNQVVKDMLTGRADAVPGLEGTDGGGVDDESPAEDDPEEFDLDLSDVDTDPVDAADDADAESDAPDIEVDFGEEEPPEPEADDGDADDSAVDDDASGDERPTIEIDVDGAVERTAATESSDDSAESTAESSSIVDPRTTNESVAAALADEIRSGRVDDDDLRAIEDALDVAPSGTELARLDHLRSRVVDLEAYTDALEEFLDENGTGTQLIAQFRDEVDSLRSTVERLEDEQDETAASVDSLDDRLGALDDEVAGVDERLEELSGDVHGIGDDVSTIEAEVADAHEQLSDVTDSLEDVTASVTDLDSDLDEVTDDLDALGDEVESVRDDVDDIVAWREQLGSMFSKD